MNASWLFFLDEEQFGRAAASHAGRLARAVLEKRPRFTLALSGGRGPLPFFRHLADAGLFAPEMWARTHIFFVDERMVPPDHAESNFGSARKHLLDRVPVPEENIHRMPGELPQVAAAAAYTETLDGFFGCRPPVFDLLVLGMGADGHTASIFPVQSPLQGDQPVSPATAPEAAVSARLTLTGPVLDAAANVLFLVLGADKHEPLRRIRSGDRNLPAGRVRGGRRCWYVCPPLPA